MIIINKKAEKLLILIIIIKIFYIFPLFMRKNGIISYFSKKYNSISIYLIKNCCKIYHEALISIVW
jgi:hypothetical protein